MYLLSNQTYTTSLLEKAGDIVAVNWKKAAFGLIVCGLIIVGFKWLYTASISFAFQAGDTNFQINPKAPAAMDLEVSSVQSEIPAESAVISAPEIKKIPKVKNDVAPVSTNDMDKEIQVAYIERFAGVAQVEMQKFGIPASISLAQGLVESRSGHSTLARRNNNHFGMKCFSKKCRKGHCSNHTDDHHKDFFRIYKNSWESWRAHSQMLASGRYTTLKKYGKDYRKWAYGLKSLGYATDRNYAEKLIGMIERHNLQRFDK